jgi:hypothetical protein
LLDTLFLSLNFRLFWFIGIQIVWVLIDIEAHAPEHDVVSSDRPVLGTNNQPTFRLKLTDISDWLWVLLPVWQ